MLNPARANALTGAINDAFAAIGAGGVTGMPKSKGNHEPLAWDYHVATHLLRIAEARKKTAQAAAVRAGVMFDPEKQPLEPGTNALVYAGDVVEIAVAVTTPRATLDTVGLFAALVSAGVKQSLLDRLVAAHTRDSRAPHKFTATLITARS